MPTPLLFARKRVSMIVLSALAASMAAPGAHAGAGWADNTDKSGTPFKQPTFYANSPIGVRAAHGPLGANGTIIPGVSEGSTRDTGTALRKFVDSLPLVDGYITNAQLLSANSPTGPGRHIPTAIREAAGKQSYVDADYYEIAVVEYREQLHSDLPPVVTRINATTSGTITTGGTLLRGYVQIWTPNLPATAIKSPLWRLDGTAVLDNRGQPVFLVGDKPHYLGPIIDSQSGRGVRLRFDNYLPVGHYDPITGTRGGDSFIPTDHTMPGSGLGPNGAIDPNAPQAFERYTENRANIHLHGGDTPWISDGEPHTWITPAGENTPYPVGATTQNVPDMADPGPGAMTYYYPNNQSSRMEWYHDHSFGATRLDVYAGIVSAFLIHDATEVALQTAGSVIPRTTVAGGALAGMDEIPLIFEDKTFVPKDIAVEDARWNVDAAGNPVNAWGQYGDLWFPHVYEANQNPDSIDGTNPAGRWDYGPWFWPVFPAPLALPTGVYGDVSSTQEQYADTPLINGMAYPNLNLEPKAYRFRLLNASLQRYLNLGLYLAEPLSIGVTNGGANYSAATQASVPADSNGVVPVLNVNLLAGSIVSITVTAPQGAVLNYAAPPVVTVTDTSGSGATVITSINTEVPMVPASVDPGLMAALPTSFAPAPGTPYPASVFHPGQQDGYYTQNTYDGRPGGIPDPLAAGPNIIQIGTEGGFLAQPNVIGSTPVSYQQLRRIVTVLNVLEHGLYVGPAERADFVVDFSQFAGRTLIVYNDCPAPNPGFDARVDYYSGDGDFTASGGQDSTLPGYGPNTRTLMRIRVAGTQFSGAAPAAAYDPTNTGGPLATQLPAAFASAQDKPVIPQSWQNAAYGTAFVDNLAHIYTGTHQQPEFHFNAGSAAGTVTTIQLDSAGAGYTLAPQVSISGGGGSGATAFAMVDSATKRIVNIVVTNPGSGYTSQPVVTLLGGDGIGASATAITSGDHAFVVQPKGIQELFESNYGRMNATFSVELPFTSVATQTTIPVGYVDPPSEQIADGETQFWKVTHNGVDTHVVHFHLFNVQVINRVAWDGTIVALDPAEFGWKETVKMNPLEDIYVAVKPKSPKAPFGVPQSVRPLDPTQAIGASAGFSQVDVNTGLAATVTNQMYNFDWEYVWHCHILGHEENDFMRPMVFGFGTQQPADVTGLNYNSSTGALTWIDATPPTLATTYGNKANEQGFLIQRTDKASGAFDALPATPPQSASMASLNPAGTYPNPVYPQVYVVPANTTSWTDPVPVTRNTLYRVMAFNSAGYASNYITSAGGTNATGSVTPTTTGVSFSSLPNAPVGLTSAVGGTANGGFPVTLTWTAAPAPRNGFTVVRAGGLSATGATIPNLTLSLTSAATLVPGTTNTYRFTDPTAAEASGYTYSVVADNGTAGTPLLSAASMLQVFTPYVAPPVITGTSASVVSNGDAVALNWSMPAFTTPGNGAPAAPHVTAFNVVRVHGGVSKIFSVRQTSNPLSSTMIPPVSTYTDTDITAIADGTPTTYTVYAVNGDLTSNTVDAGGGSAVTLSIQAFGAPGLQGATATATAPTSVTVNWAPAPAGTAVTGYTVMRSVVGSTAAPVTLVNSGSVGTSFVDTTAHQHTAYTYAVNWINANAAAGANPVGLAQTTAAVTTPYGPATPISQLAVTVNLNGGSNTLSWTDRGDATNFIVSRAVVNPANVYNPATAVFTQLGGANAVVTAGANGTFSLTDNASANNGYVYRVQAQNGPVNIDTGTLISVVDAAPVAPGAVTPAISTGAVTISWTPGTSSSQALVTGYQVLRSVNNGAFSVLNSTSATSYSDSSVVAGNTYQYQVSAVITVSGYPTAVTPIVSAPSTSVATAAYLAPNPPVLKATTVSSSGTPSVTINWSAPAAVLNGAAVSGYQVYRDNVAIGAVLAAAAKSYVDSGMTVGAHSYTVAAINAVGQTQSVATSINVTVPPVPTLVAATVAGGTTSATLTFSTSATTSAFATSSLQVWASVNGAPATQMITTPATLTAASSTAAVAIVPGSSYVFSVKAVNLVGASLSASSSVLGLPALPAAPAVVTAIRNTAVQGAGTTYDTLSVTWTPALAPTGGQPAVTSYVVQTASNASFTSNVQTTPVTVPVAVVLSGLQTTSGVQLYRGTGTNAVAGYVRVNAVNATGTSTGVALTVAAGAGR